MVVCRHWFCFTGNIQRHRVRQEQQAKCTVKKAKSGATAAATAAACIAADKRDIAMRTSSSHEVTRKRFSKRLCNEISRVYATGGDSPMRAHIRTDPSWGTRHTLCDRCNRIFVYSCIEYTLLCADGTRYTLLRLNVKPCVYAGLL